MLSAKPYTNPIYTRNPNRGSLTLNSRFHFLFHYSKYPIIRYLGFWEIVILMQGLGEHVIVEYFDSWGLRGSLSHATPVSSQMQAKLVE